MSLLLCRAAVRKSSQSVLLIEEVLPGVLVFTLQRRNHDFLLVGESEQLMAEAIKNDTTERS